MKSYIAAWLTMHEWLFDGLTEYIPANQVKTSADIIMGASDAKYSGETLGKAKIYLDMLPGTYETYDTKYPSPLSKKYKGSWGPSKDVIAEYKKKVKGNWEDVGTKSIIRHRTFKDNPYAGQGSRNSLIIAEEIGAWGNFLECFSAMVDNQQDGSFKFGSMFMWGCVCEGTKVYDSNGKYVNIENLNPTIGVLGYDGKGANKEHVPWGRVTYDKPCYRITLAGGQILECSEDHPILSSHRDNVKSIKGKNHKIFTFTRTDSLKKGDQVAMINKIDVFGDKDVPEARLLGLAIGDGYYGNSAGALTISANEEEIKKFLVENYNAKVKKIKKNKNSDNECVEFYIPKQWQLLKEFLMVGESKESKHLPDEIHLWSKQSIADLLAGYFDADGAAIFDKRNQLLRITLTSAYIHLLDEVRAQLNKFGIDSFISEEKRKTGYSPNTIKYVLYITKRESIVEFYNNIKLLCNHKQSAIESYMTINKSFKIKSKRYAYVKSSIDGKGKYFESLESLENIKIRRITKVESIGNRPVYNINAATKTNTYLANGIITHNTGGMMEEGVAAAMDIFYDPDKYNCITFEDIWEQKGQICFFMPAYLSLNDAKNRAGKTDLARALATIHDKREKLRSDKGSKERLQKEMQYRPIKPSEMFLTKTGNFFPIVELKNRLTLLESTVKPENWAKKVRLVFDNKSSFGVSYEIDTQSELTPIDKYPWRGSSKEGCVVLYEVPVYDRNGVVPEGLYIIGHDPVATDSVTGESYACTWVMKTKKYWQHFGHDELVAVHVSRPYEGRSTINENLLKLSMLYGNAKVYFENAVGNVKEYFEKMKRLDLLARQPTTVFNKKASFDGRGAAVIYGYPMSNRKIKLDAVQYVRDWLLEERGTDEQGNTVRNLDRIWDKALLQELIAYDLDGNFDRVSALMGCVIGLNETHNQYESSVRAAARELSNMNSLKILMSNKLVGLWDEQDLVPSAKEKARSISLDLLKYK